MTDPKHHPLIFSAPMILAALDGRKRQTRRVVTPHNSLIDGSGQGVKAHWEHLKWDLAEPRLGGSEFWVPCSRPRCIDAFKGKGPPLGVFGLNGIGHVVTPRYQVGDLVWGKEAFDVVASDHHGFQVRYYADDKYQWISDQHISDLARSGDEAEDWTYRACVMAGEPDRKRSPIYMPRWAARFERPIVRVGAERVQGIGEEDAAAEGVRPWFPEHLDRSLVRPGGSFRNGFRALWNSINGSKPGRDWASNPPVWPIEWGTE